MTTCPNLSIPPAAHWWTKADHDVVVSVVRRLGARHVLEFGPGTSTLSLIEGGATLIDACEDDPHWFKVHRERLAVRFPDAIRMRPYRWTALPSIVGCDSTTFDLGLVDGPKETERRPAVIVYAMERCRHVLVPLEEEAASPRGFAKPSCGSRACICGPWNGSKAPGHWPAPSR